MTLFSIHNVWLSSRRTWAPTRRVFGDLIGMPPRAGQADAGRVEHQILQGGNGFNHLWAGPEMIKLRLGQGRDGAGKGVDGVIAHGG